ncbi:MAG TPA: PilZ domain-containing protein [Solirubrobacteraceae bacterium]|jgi:hypothetical protein
MSPRPRRAQSVTIHFGDAAEGAELSARVDAADDDEMTLVLAQPPEGVDRMRDRPAVIEYKTPRGVYRLSGEIAGTGDGPEVLRVRRDGHDDVIQRRDFVRVEASVPLRVTITDPVRGAARTTTLDLSGGGLLVSDPIGIPPGTEVDIELTLVPGEPPIVAAGRVVREVAHDAKGVQIEHISRGDRERLVRFVTERERMAMKLAKGR